MTVAENVESRQVSNSDLNGVQVSAMYDINKHSYADDLHENDSQNNGSINTEANILLLMNGHNQHSEPQIQAKKNACNERNGNNKYGAEKNLENGIGCPNEPPDGGWRAWMILLGSFFINGILFSIINTYTLIYVDLQKSLKAHGDSETSSKAALVGSLTIGATFFLSPIAGILTNKIGIRMTTFLGGIIASSGMFLSSFVTDKVEILCLTYGVMFGIGASLAYTPSLVILGHYFKRYLGLVNGIVTAGSSIFTVALPFVTEPVLAHFGLEATFRFLATFVVIIPFCAVLFKPILLSTDNPKPEPEKTKCLKSKINKIINISIWKRKKFIIWAGAIPIALFGYFVPYVHIGRFVEITFLDDDVSSNNTDNNSKLKLPLLCIGITSGIGRLVFGYIADLPRVDRILLQQISFFGIGILTMLLPITTNFVVLLIISLAMGLFDGCFISLLGPIAFDICGKSGATQAISFLLGMCSIPLTAGPPLAGRLYDRTGSYTLPFILAGIPPLIGGAAMFLVRCVDDEEPDKEVSKNELENPAWQNGKADAMSILPTFNEVAGKQDRSIDDKELQDVQNGSASLIV